MNEQQLNRQPHFSRLLAIFHERELLLIGLVINLSVIVLFGLASNPPHLQTYAQAFLDREFEPETPAPSDCNGQCVYSYNSGGWFKKEAQPGGGIGFTPCQSTTSCGGSSSGSGSSGSGSGSSGGTGNTAGINNPNCATSVGCSQVKPNGSTIFCVSGLCTECNAGGSCARAGEWPANIVNNGNFCSGPGCSPGSITPTQCAAGSTSCTAQSPGSGPGALNYTQALIGNQLVEFEAESRISKDGKYIRTCGSSGSCTISPNTGGAGGGNSGGSGTLQNGSLQNPFNFTLDATGPHPCQYASGTCFMKSVQSGVLYSCTNGQCQPTQGSGTASDPFQTDFNASTNNQNPCSGVSGECYIQSRSTNITYRCENGSCTPVQNSRELEAQLVPGYSGLGTSESPFTRSSNAGSNTPSNPCSGRTGACFYVDANGQTNSCLNGSCGVSVIDPKARPNYQAPTNDSGSQSDPYQATSTTQLQQLCGQSAQCYGQVNGVLFECRNGSCHRPPPGGVGSPLTGGNTSDFSSTKGSISESSFVWPGASYGGMSLFSVNGVASQPAFVCGDLVCSGNETSASCPQDCGGSSVACTVGQARRLVCE